MFNKKRAFAALFLFCVSVALFAQTRARELVIANGSLGISNTYLPTGRLLSEFYNYIFEGTRITMEKDLFNRNLSAELTADLRPFSYRWTNIQKTSFDIFTGLETHFFAEVTENTARSVYAIIDHISDPSSINPTGIKGEASVAFSLFFETGLGISKTVIDKRMTVRAAASIFMPLAYIKKSTVTLNGYTHSTTGSGYMGMRGKGLVTMYAPFDIERFNLFDIFSGAGVDADVEALYALTPKFDIGARISHIPFIPSNLHYRSAVGIDLDIKVPDLTSPYWNGQNVDEAIKNVMMNTERTIEISEKSDYYVLRPVRFSLRTLFKPYSDNRIVIKPSLGLSVNTILSPAEFNYGLSAEYNKSFFSGEIGTERFESTYRNYIKLSFDFNFFAVAFGANLQSPKWTDSWKGSAGFGAFASFTFGL